MSVWWYKCKLLVYITRERKNFSTSGLWPVFHWSVYSGTKDDSLFESWLGSEHTEVERALGGEEVNTGVGDRSKEVKPF